MSGTAVGFQAMCLRAWYPTSGTDRAYGATRALLSLLLCREGALRMVQCAHALMYAMSGTKIANGAAISQQEPSEFCDGYFLWRRRSDPRP
eukprot:1685116-Rhodomonas_salina.7